MNGSPCGRPGPTDDRAGRPARPARRTFHVHPSPADPPTTAEPRAWIDWAPRLVAIALTGPHYTEKAFDRERYEQVRTIAAEMLSAPTDGEVDELVPLRGRDAASSRSSTGAGTGIRRASTTSGKALRRL